MEDLDRRIPEVELAGCSDGGGFRRAANALDLHFELLASNELNASPEFWEVAATTPHSVISIDQTTEIVRYADSQTTAGALRFLRLKVTYVP